VKLSVSKVCDYATPAEEARSLIKGRFDIGRLVKDAQAINMGESPEKRLFKADGARLQE